MNNLAEAQLIKNRPESLNRLLAFLKIPSISTEATHGPDCVEAALWLKNQLAEIGFAPKLVGEGDHAALIAHGPQVSDAPRILFYGHYDVQPADEPEKWELPPFQPAVVVREGRDVIHGRGAADDKGQLLTFVEACRALAETGGIPLNITFLIEGEEEVGSPSMQQILLDHADDLQADVVFICDTAMLGVGKPAIGCQLRGFVGEIITVKAANSDLHSGNYGGAARNPALVLAKALSSIIDEAGSITLPGFYDQIREIQPAVRKDWEKLTELDESLLPDVGLKRPAGEAGRSVLEQVWARPSFDINSLWSGYLGPGFKTVLPATAHAKVSFRLVSGQQPPVIREAFRTAIRRYLPDDCAVEFEAFGSVAAVEMDVNRPEFVIARAEVEGVWKAPCAFIGMGGSIPIVGLFKSELGLDSLLLGFSLLDDGIHSSNEKYDLESFHKGALCWLRILQRLGINQVDGHNMPVVHYAR